MDAEPSLSPSTPLDRFLSGFGARVSGHSLWFAVLCLVLGVLLAATAVYQKSVTVDEFSVLPHGLGILRTGSFHLDPGIPPLASELSALPLLDSAPRFDPNTFMAAESTWQFGAQFMRDNPEHYHDLFMWGRIVPLAFLFLTGLLTFGFARSVYGPSGGLLTAVAVAAMPGLLAHGALITPDIFLTAGFIGALWAFDGLIRHPTWQLATALGIALGVASLAKFTGLLLFVIFPVILVGFTLADHWQHRTNTPWRRAWIWMLGACAVAMVVINVGYFFAGTFSSLGDFNFTTDPFRSIQSALPPSLPVPLPHRFVMSMDAQLAEGGYTAYLWGEFNDTGFRSYYLMGLLVKTPIAVLLLCLLAFLCDRRLHRREIPMLLTAAAILVFFSLSRHKNIGMRYVLFLEPLMAMWIGRLACAWTQSWQRSRLAWATLAGVAWLWGATCVAWPNYLAYFNEIAGGPAKGHKYLLDSNLDWGQDLLALKKYMVRERIDTIDLAYFGRVDPSIYGIAYGNFFGDSAPANRYVAISANLLWGRNYFVNGTPRWSAPDAYKEFRAMQPRAVLGHTIYVFDMGRLRPQAK